MKKSIQSLFLAFVVLTVLLSGCAPASTPIPPTQIPPTFTPSPIPPTFTPEPTATEEPTALLSRLKPDNVTLNLKQRGFTCDAMEEMLPYYLTTCRKGTVDYSLKVDIWGREVLAVDVIQSTVLQFANQDNEFAASFLGDMATMPHDGAVQEEARNWVETTLPSLTGQSDVREKVCAGVKYRLSGIPTAFSLEIGDLP